jgi:malonate decarboxylase beta subunit
MEDVGSRDAANWFAATARQRVSGLLDKDSFIEFLDPSQRIESPHLHLFDLPAAFDDGVIIGRGSLDGEPVLVAAQEGQFMGGTFAEVSGAKMVGLLRAARDHEELPRTVLLLLDSGGVRLQEANAGELAVAEVMRAIAHARHAGVTVVAAVGGKAGAFGGAEVIETNKGVEEFDSANKALVWSVVGGKNRVLIGGADAFAKATIDGFREAIKLVMGTAPAFDLKTLQAEQKRLQARVQKFGDCDDAVSMWRKLGIKHPEAVRDMDDDAFLELAHSMKETAHDAR